MARPDRLVSGLAIGTILLMAAALAADVAVNSTNIDLTGYADIVGPPPASSDAVLEVRMTGVWPGGRAGEFFAVSTGTAVWAHTLDGRAVHARSTHGYGVWGESTNSWGGYFTSSGGYGVRIDSTGNAHYDHGAYITSAGGFAVYAQSDNNQALRGEAGDISGISSGLGRIGAVGMGENRGVHGASLNGLGVYGTSTNSTGVFGNTSRSDRNYGLYTNDNLFSLNVNLFGSIKQIAQNTGDDRLEVGDVVALAGIGVTGRGADDDAEVLRRLGYDPASVVQVVRASGGTSGLVVGVVHSRYSLDALVALGLDVVASESAVAEVDPLAGKTLVEGPPPELTPAGDIESGEFLLVVVHGPALVHVDASLSSIGPGDALALSAVPGRAIPADAAARNDGRSSAAIVGAALEPIVSGQQLARVFVAPR